MPVVFGDHFNRMLGIFWDRDSTHDATIYEKVNAGDTSKKEVDSEENLHQLERGETRRSCAACYNKLSKQHGRMKAQNSTRKTHLKCYK